MQKLNVATAAPGPFEEAIKAGAGSVMCSCATPPHPTRTFGSFHFNRCRLSMLRATDNLINGTYSCENKHTLTDHLKGLLNFSGWVVSDWCVRNIREPRFHVALRFCAPWGLLVVENSLSAVRAGVPIMVRSARSMPAWIKR